MSINRLRSTAVAVATIAVVVTAATNASARTLPSRTAPPRAAKTWEVKMITQDGKQLFEPAELTIQAGDTVKWLAVSGSHNVGFWADSVPAGAVELLRKAMPDTIAPLLGVRKPIKGDSYVVVFAGMPKGTYKYYCKPHLNKLMVAQLTIK